MSETSWRNTIYLRFSGGGDITITSCAGPVVLGGTTTEDQDEVIPLKDGDCATSCSIENKQPTNTQKYDDVEFQLLANMHLSASECLATALMKGSIDPDEVKKTIAYGTILKPGTNMVALYKLVSPFNEPSNIQGSLRLTETRICGTLFTKDNNFIEKLLMASNDKLSVNPEALLLQKYCINRWCNASLN